MPMGPLVKVCALILLIGAVVPAPAYGQASIAADTFPNRAVKIIVPFPPGGTIDLMTRALGQKLSDEWKQPVIVENRAGGNSAIGASSVAQADPDGYTLMIAMDLTLVYNPLTVSKLPYKPSDFVPISLTTSNAGLIIVPADGPKTVTELIAKAKAAPGKLNYGVGVFSMRLAGYLFNSLAGTQATEIVYRGSSEIVQGLLTGSIDYSLDGLAASLAMVREGKLRPLAKLNGRPLPALPNLPRLADTPGLAEFGDSATWAGIVAPAGTPTAIVNKVQKSVGAALSNPDVIDKLDSVGVSLRTSTPAEFSNFIQEETTRWSKVFKDSKLKVD